MVPCMVGYGKPMVGWICRAIMIQYGSLHGAGFRKSTVCSSSEVLAVVRLPEKPQIAGKEVGVVSAKLNPQGDPILLKQSDIWTGSKSRLSIIFMFKHAQNSSCPLRFALECRQEGRQHLTPLNWGQAPVGQPPH